MKGTMRSRRPLCALLAGTAALCLALFAAVELTPASVRALESFEQAANWTMQGGENSSLTEEEGGGVKISNGQARYNIGLPIGAADVTSVTVRVSYLGTWSKGWQSIGFSPLAAVVPNGGCFWPQNNPDVTGIFFVFNADSNGKVHRVFADPLPAGQGHLGEYAVAAGESWVGTHTLSLVKNADNTLSVYFDGVKNAVDSAALDNFVDGDGMTYLNIDDGNAAQIVVRGVSVGKGTFAGGSGVLDPAAWTQVGGDKQFNGSDELWISGGQSAFHEGIDFSANTFRSVKVKFRIANVNDWASVGFAKSADPLGAGGCFWGEGAPGVYFVLGAPTGANPANVHRVFYSSTGGGKVNYDFPVPAGGWAGDHTVELVKNADGSLSMLLDGVRASANTFSVADLAGEAGVLYLQVDDSNGNQVVMRSLVLNDEQGPALTLAGEIPQSDLKTGKQIVLPAGSASDRVDKAAAVRLTVTGPTGQEVPVGDGNAFTPESAGNYLVRYEAADLSGNSTKLEQELVVESSAEMPELTVGAWEIENPTVGDTVTFPEAHATLAGEPVDVAMTLHLPDGTEATLSAREYLTAQTGPHRLVYSAQGTGDKVAKREFSFTVLPKLTSEDAVKPEIFGNPVYWNFDPASAVLTDGDGAGLTLAEVNRGATAVTNYLVPLSFADRIKIFFTVGSPGDWVCFGLTKTPVAVNDFNAVESSKPHDTDGVYFMMAGNAYNVTATYQRQYKYLGNAQTNPAYPFSGTHSIEFIRGKSGFTLKLDGQECPSGELGNVAHDTFVNADGETYLAFGIKNTAQVTITQITNEVDERAPKITAQADLSAQVGEHFDIPQLTATDDKDGVVPVHYTLYDAYGRAVSLADGETSVLLIFEGEWRIEYVAYDSSGNRAGQTVRIFVDPNPDLPAFWTDGTPAPNGRAGVEFVLPEHHVDADGRVSVTVAGPDEEEDITAAGKFTPAKIGAYTITYTVTAEDGQYYQVLYFVYVKINVDVNTTMDPEVFNNPDNWVQTAENSVAPSADGLTVAGNAAYSYPLDMSIGIVFDLRLDALGLHTVHNTWLGLALMPKAGQGNFAEYSQTGLYLMFYNDNGTLAYNVGTYNSAGTFVYAGSGVAGTYAPGMPLSIKLMKYNGGNNQYFDNIVLYVNGVENMVPTMYQIHYSDIVDDENFTFLAVSRFGSVTSEVTSMTICGMKIADIVKPQIHLPEYPKTAQVGDVLDLSGITFSDNEEGLIVSEMRIQTPDGFVLLGTMLEGGKLTLEKAGKYSVTVIATDSSGNFEFEVVNVEVEAPPARGCGGRLAGGEWTLGLGLLATGLGIWLASRKRRHE